MTDLRDYVQHTADCQRSSPLCRVCGHRSTWLDHSIGFVPTGHRYEPDEQPPCTCGLEAALAATPPPDARLLHALNNCEIHKDVEGIQERTACAVCFTECSTKLEAIQDALVDAFYDPDPADPTPAVDYDRVDWVGVVKDARQVIDKLKER